MTAAQGPRAVHGDGWEYTTDPIDGWQVRARYDGPEEMCAAGKGGDGARS